jgi:predicted MFS family arabinose efflux permease
VGIFMLSLVQQYLTQELGAVMGQALGGTVGQALGPLAPFRIAALMLLVALALTFVHMQHQQRQKRVPAAV